MAVALSPIQATIFARTRLFRKCDGLTSFRFCMPFSTSVASASSDNLSWKKWRQPVVSALDIGGVKISREGTVAVG